ncbi:MAG TPA: dienelactone hydrolase family protein [Sphingomicrobium sp.]|jgi:carboxymethylenebutenolidase
MCGDGNHQGFIVDTAVTRRTLLLTLSAVAATGLPAGAAAHETGGKHVVERDVTVAIDGNADAALFYPEGKGRWPAVLLWPDILGLRPVFREMGRRLAAQGYVVLVPNPYYRAQKAPVVTGPFDFGKPADREKIMGFRKGVTDAMVDRDSAAFVSFLDAQPQTDRKRRVGVQGYCMSGPFAFRTAAARSDRIGAVAAFHPGTLVTNEPSSPHLLIPKTKAAYLVLLGKNDAAERPEEIETLKAAFAAAKRPARVDSYPADHGWTVAGSQSYNEREAERAWSELLALYRANLR